MTPQQLKNSILQYAIQGKLVEQRAEEGTAEELYAQIQEEKQKLIKEGKIKKEKPLAPITDDEIPFDIPKSWKWCRLNELCNLISDGSHKTPNYTDSGIPFLSVKDISSGTLDFSDTKFISLEEHNLLVGRCKPEIDDVLFCRIGTLGKAIKINQNREFSIFVSLGLLKLTNSKIADYIVQIINSSYGYEWMQSVKAGAGTHAAKLNLVDIRNFIIPLPPLAEQKRIVAKIEELMALADKYADSYLQLEALNKKFPADIQKSILQYAIQGKLVEQRTEEGTAEELYAKIQEEKQKLIKEGKLKKEKPLAPITDKEIPFDIPESWKWVRLSDCIEINPTVKFDDEKDVSFIPMTNISSGYKSEISLVEVKKWGAVKKNFSRFEENDVVVAKITPCFQNRKSAIVRNLVNGHGAGTTELNILRTNENIHNSFVLFYVKTEYFISYGIANFTGTAGQQRFGGESLKNILFPLPPLAEQKRIVAKIEELMAIVKKLE